MTPVPVKPPSAAAPKISFVVIDDHRSVVDSLAFALERKYLMQCVGKFSSIASAVAGLPALSPTVIIADWRFGDGTGDELLRLFGPQLPSTRWLLCTATPTVYVLKEAIAAGVHGCVAKSSDFEEVARAVEALANGRNYFCSASQTAMMGSVNSGLHQLTTTELNILRLVARGLEPKSIAAELGLAEKTIYNNLGTMRERLKSQAGHGSLVDLARFARQQGIAAEE